MRYNTTKKICVIGHFGFGKDFSDGQTVKTKIVSDELERRYGAGDMTRIDTEGGKKQILSYPYLILKALEKHDNIIILPAHNGLRVIAPLLALENRCFHRRLHYVVIGGWLPEYLRAHPHVAKALRHFHGIYVETETMKKALAAMGYGNVYVLPNCKQLTILPESDLVYQTEEPFRLCTFSRVMKEKGIQDAVEAVETINRQQGKTVYTLDIYGQIDERQRTWFTELQKSFPDYVRYRGIVPYDKSVNVLKNYFALLFPTYYSGEGFAGTLIDAMASGVPALASDWKYNPEIINENNGVCYRANDATALRIQLDSIRRNPQAWNKKKRMCLQAARNYEVSNVITVLVKNL